MRNEVLEYQKRPKINWNTGTLYCQLALHFRLSLSTMHILLRNLKTPQMTREEVEKFLIYHASNEQALTYLFRYELASESREEEARKMRDAIRFLNELKTCPNRQKKLQELIQIDLDFQALRAKTAIDDVLTDDEFLLVEKYRLKHALSEGEMSQAFTRERSWILRREKRLADERLRTNLTALNEYFNDIYYTRGYKK